jgi:O-antigen chain-terminating methyltransferase
MEYNKQLLPDSREDVKNSLKIYLEEIREHFGGNLNIRTLDLGCGNAEWIELLAENGYRNNTGIDSNRYVIENIKNFGFNIIESGACEYMKNVPDNSYDLITCMHVVEHLELYEIIDLISEIKRILRPGGLLIMETPNPENIMTSTYYFHLDPTHKKIIPPTLLAFYVSFMGLKVKKIIKLKPLNLIDYKDDNPLKHIVFKFNMEQAYSVLGVKEK